MKNFENLKPKVIETVSNVLDQFNLRIYEVNNFSEFGEDVLQILLEDKTEPRKPLDFDLLTKVNEVVSDKMDELDDLIKNNYMLEVASAGVEKQIKSQEELENAVGEYVYVEFNKPEKNIDSFNGTIEEFNKETGEYLFSFFVKGQKKKRISKYEDIKFVRYAIKF